MKNRSRQRGSFLFSAVLFFVIISSLILASIVALNMGLGQSLYRDLWIRQADCLVQGAIERGLLAIQNASVSSASESQEFSEKIAPIYVESDPLEEDEAESRRVVVAHFGYRIQSAPALLLPAGVQKGWILTGRCELPFRNRTMTRLENHLCYRTTEQGWKNIPLVDRPSEP